MWDSLSFVVVFGYSTFGMSHLSAGAILHDTKVATYMGRTMCCPAIARRHVASSADPRGVPAHHSMCYSIWLECYQCLAGSMWKDQPYLVCPECLSYTMMCKWWSHLCLFLKLQPYLHSFE